MQSNIVEKLLEYGLSLEQIAVKTGAAYMTVYNWSHRKRQPRNVYQKKLNKLVEQMRKKAAEKKDSKSYQF